jgi:hypothetical protein
MSKAICTRPATPEAPQPPPAQCAATEPGSLLLASPAGPAFLGVDRHGRVASGRLNAGSIARIVKRAAESAGLDLAGYASHSPRAGFATQAFLNGATEVAIMRQTRHKLLDTLRKYIRDRSPFPDNPAAKPGL